MRLVVPRGMSGDDCSHIQDKVFTFSMHSFLLSVSKVVRMHDRDKSDRFVKYKYPGSLRHSLEDKHSSE